MKLLLSLFTCICVFTLGAQTTVRIETPACRQKMDVFALNGTGYYKVTSLKSVAKTDTLADGQVSERYVYTWEAADREPAIYYIGQSMRAYVPVVVGADPTINIAADCGKMRQATVSGSALNQGYGRLRATLNSNNGTFAQLSQDLRSATEADDQADIARITAMLKQLDQQKIALLDSLKSTAPFLGRIASANTYTSFAGEDNTPYGNELEHYVNTFWRHVDFNDPSYNGLNAVYEATSGYVNTVAQAVEAEKATDIINRLIEKWPAGSKARFYTLGGAFNVLNQRSHPSALAVAEQLVAEYEESEPVAVAAVAKAFNKLRTSTPGALAPDLTGPNPAGETISLSDLRGKVVLLDFWASWCGPCRKENPNVKKLYDKYASQGFEILGVSLDRTKSRWEQAIASDGLNWLHISDLKHWGSEHARLYGVRSIPDTVLLDAEGKIIARGLRGAQLEAKLAQLFNEGK